METVCGMETMSEIQTIIFAVTGKNMSPADSRGIGIAIGTDIATIGGMVTDAVSSMDRG
jgi:hypothetical protein